jgi:rhodanese-related sulfurtransferase
MASNLISPEEANARVLAGEPIVFVDARNSKAWESSDRKIPGAVRVPADEVEQHLNEIDPKSTVITYCTCPSEESSLKAAKALNEHGYSRAFALRGGFDAWVAAEYPLEPKTKAA